MVMKPPPHDRQGHSEANATEITGVLVAGPALWAAAGYGLDRWLGTHFLVIGAAAGVYLVYVKWGKAVNGA
jgi:F0F1-type ATP synthase assembly protein I